jgi:hypothetical protein
MNTAQSFMEAQLLTAESSTGVAVAQETKMVAVEASRITQGRRHTAE